MSSNRQLVLESVCSSIRNVIPRPLKREAHENHSAPLSNNEMGIAITFSNTDIYQMKLIGHREVFSRMGEVIFGMYVEDDMLDSCVGEMANIIAGGAATLMGSSGVPTDISLPSLLGDNPYNGDNLIIDLPICIEEIGNIHLVFNS
jgi:chemotaxis protein CheX